LGQSLSQNGLGAGGNDTEIDLSVGKDANAYDNIQAECVIGLLNIAVINQIGPWKPMSEVEGVVA
jgi:hypothetical protein